ncbi:MAG: MOSC domain-containing protein [Xanthomonadales bacterium]|nr:MOSC domain-containing protein [Xanthomonadales bacterium]
MKLTAINIYPLKSCHRVELNEALITPLGLAHDRHWMLVDDKHRFISARKYPQLLRLSVDIRSAGFVAAYKGLPGIYIRYPENTAERYPVTIWKDEVAVLDAGDTAADWFSQVIGKSCRLVWSSTESARRLKPGNYPPPTMPAGERQITFTDGMPILLTNTASLDELNSHLDETVSMHRFRANIVVDGRQAWEEESWQRIRIGELELQATKTCVRCILTTADPQTGVRDPQREPLKTLSRIHCQKNRGAIFGMQFVALNSGTVKIGDHLKIE